MPIDFTKTKKCIMPWIHLNIEPNGEIHPCCDADISAPDLGNLKDGDIKSLLNGPKMVKLRQQMIDGEEPENCKRCYERERNMPGVLKSKRIRESETYEDLWHLTENTLVDNKIYYTDIRYSNVCNFKCRMCFPSASHGISQDFIQLAWIEKEDIVRTFNKESVDQLIDENITNLREVYFAGGEPLYMEEHWNFLDKLISAGNTNLLLRYNSNLSSLTYKGKNILDYWKHFTNVKMNASIDHVGSKLEYIRHGSNWSQIVSNLQSIQQLKNVDMQVQCVVSVLNICDLYDIYNTFNSLNIQVDLNPLNDPKYLHILTLHPDLKIKVKESISRLLEDFPNLSEKNKVNLSGLIRFIDSENLYQEYKEEFKLRTESLDKIRNENFLTTFPNLALQMS